MFWFVLAALLAVSATLNALQVVAVDDRDIQLLRGGLSVTLLLLAALALRKGLADRSRSQELTPGATAASSAGRQGLIVVGVVVAIIAVVIGAKIATRGPTLTMPEQLAGHAQLHGPTYDQLLQSAESEVGGHPVFGIFGTPEQPRFLVAGFDQTLAPGDDLFSEIAGAVEGPSATKISVDASKGTTRTVGSVTYTCVPYTLPIEAGGTISSTLCDWNDGDSYGIVMSLDPTLDASDLVPVAYGAVVE